MVFKSKCTYKINKTLICVLFAMIAISSTSCTDVDLVEKPNTTAKVNLPSSMVDSVKSDSYTVEINGQKLLVNSENSDLPVLAPGVYPILTYNNTNTISVVDGIAEVNTVNGQLNSFPDWFFSGYTNLNITNALFENQSINLEQQVRLLKLVITPPIGGVYDQITSIEGKLTGVAGRWDLKNNIPLGPSREVSLVFKKQSNGTWFTEILLLGVFGNTQELIADIQYSDVNQKVKIMSSSSNLKANQLSSINLYSDLSDELKSFNTSKDIPLNISGSIELPVEVGFTVTIQDWIRTTTESGTAW